VFTAGSPGVGVGLAEYGATAKVEWATGSSCDFSEASLPLAKRRLTPSP
jgi:hypothetical protein